MKKRDYVITVAGMQFYGGDDDVDIEMMSECDLTYEDGKYFVDYDETEATGMAGTSTTVEACGEYVSITRSGKISTTMLFIKGRQTTSYYDTPYGTMMISISTDEIDFNLSEDGGYITVDYSISMNNLFSGKNTFKITIRKI